MNKPGIFIIAVYFFTASFLFAQERKSEVMYALDGVEKMMGGDQLSEKKQRELITEKVDSFELSDESLENALDKISRITGLTFIIPERLSEKVTLAVNDISVWDLLSVILSEKKLAYYRTNGAVHIMSQHVFEQRYGQRFPQPFPVSIVSVQHISLESLLSLLKIRKNPEGRFWIDSKNRRAIMMDKEEKLNELQQLIERHDIPLLTEKIALQFISYDQIREEAQALLTDFIGRVDVDETGRRLVITESASKIDRIKEMIRSRDVQDKIPFHVKIIRIDLNEEHFQGVDWEAILTDYQPYHMQLMDSDHQVTDQICLGTVTFEDYEILIDALDTVGNLNNLISFNIDLTLNEEGNVGLETNDPFWSLRPGAREAKEPVVLDPNGFQMQVNLKTRREKENVFVEMLPRLHWIQEEEIDSIFAGINRAEIELSPREVIVIGGLIRTEEIARTRKVPLLGDLPMLGVVFRRERKRFENSEYVIFLKPGR